MEAKTPGEDDFSLAAGVTRHRNRNLKGRANRIENVNGAAGFGRFELRWREGLITIYQEPDRYKRPS